MRVKTGSLVVACGLAVVTFAPMDAGALACPPSDTKQAAVVQAVDAQSPSSCWKKRQVANVIVAGDVDVDGAARCPLARRASWIAKVAGSNANPACSKQYAVKFMAKALGDLRKGCSPDCTARADLVASVRTIAKSNPDLVFDAFIDVLTGNTTDGSAARVASVAYVSDPSQCRAAKAKARAQARTVAAVGGTSAGCRATRKAAALKVLASILDEMRADRAAAASDEAPQATPVSLGAIRDVTDASTPN